MEASRRMSELLESLVDQTRAGRIRWRRGSPEGFVYPARTGSVAVRRVGIPAVGWRYEVLALDKVGEPLESVTDDDSSMAGVREHGEARAKLLWDLAFHQNAEGSPELDRLLSEVRGA